jgi:hypothetical protein
MRGSPEFLLLLVGYKELPNHPLMLSVTVVSTRTKPKLALLPTEYGGNPELTSALARLGGSP